MLLECHLIEGGEENFVIISAQTSMFDILETICRLTFARQTRILCLLAFTEALNAQLYLAQMPFYSEVTIRQNFR